MLPGDGRIDAVQILPHRGGCSSTPGVQWGGLVWLSPVHAGLVCPAGQGLACLIWSGPSSPGTVMPASSWRFVLHVGTVPWFVQHSSTDSAGFLCRGATPTANLRPGATRTAPQCDTNRADGLRGPHRHASPVRRHAWSVRPHAGSHLMCPCATCARSHVGLWTTAGSVHTERAAGPCGRGRPYRHGHGDRR